MDTWLSPSHSRLTINGRGAASYTHPGVFLQLFNTRVCVCVCVWEGGLEGECSIHANPIQRSHHCCSGSTSRPSCWAYSTNSFRPRCNVDPQAPAQAAEPLSLPTLAPRLQQKRNAKRFDIGKSLRRSNSMRQRRALAVTDTRHLQFPSYSLGNGMSAGAA